MKPLQLRMQAFGPYSTAVDIDFRDLRNGGLFLIHGPTGAGKTSILDGLCFALFGTASGDRKSDGLRCDSASSELRTEVTLEFALGRDVYRVTRWPKQQLKRKRGDGLRTELAHGELFKLTGLNEAEPTSWTPLTSGDAKTDTFIYELLGMNEDQFRQVVVLPQGQFRKFLSATSDAREKLLETLFRTETHRRLTERLAERAETIRLDVQTRRSTQLALFTQLEIASSEDLQTRLTEIRDNQQRLQAGAEDLRERFEAASTRLRTAQTAARLKADEMSLQAQKSALEIEAPKIQLALTSLERDRRARPVLQIDEHVQSAEKDQALLTEKLESQKLRVVEGAKSLNAASASVATFDKLKPEMELAKEERQRLREAYHKAESLKVERETQRLAQNKLVTLERDEKQASEKAQQLKAQRETSTSKIEQLRTQTHAGQSETLNRRSTIELHTSQLKALTQEFAHVTSCEERQKLAAAKQNASQQSHASAQKSYSHIKLDEHLFQAARLAKELKVDLPCPVCGSLKHPTPATDSPAAADLAQKLDVAEHALRLATDTLARDIAQVESGARELEQARARLRELAPTDPTKQLADLKADVLRLQNLEKEEAAKLIALDRDLKNESATLTKTTAELALVEKSLSAATSLRDQARLSAESSSAKIQALESLLPEDLRDVAVLKTRGLELATKITEFETGFEKARMAYEAATRTEAAAREGLATFTAELVAKTADVVARSAERSASLLTSGFATLEEGREARLAPAILQQLEQQSRLFAENQAINTSRLKEVITELTGLAEWAFALPERQADFEVVDRERTEAGAQRLASEERLANLTAAAQKLADLEREIKASEARYAVFGKLASVATGQPPHNLSRVSFQRFVLASFLDDVLAEASRRLFAMSRGQFILKRAVTQEDKRRTAGLELEVEDALSGTSRSTTSLSGGEGFMASLSLALGLADVVQSQLGGMRLEAVFVDEGFGTLDAESLELAMRSMSDLQAGGRVVGVISHVSELKEQITRRLHVRKGLDGSHAAWEI